MQTVHMITFLRSMLKDSQRDACREIYCAQISSAVNAGGQELAQTSIIYLWHKKQHCLNATRRWYQTGLSNKNEKYRYRAEHQYSIVIVHSFTSKDTDLLPGMGTRRKSSRQRRDADLPRPRRWLHQPRRDRDVGTSRNRLKTKTSRPRPQPCLLLLLLPTTDTHNLYTHCFNHYCTG